MKVNVFLIAFFCIFSVTQASEKIFQRQSFNGPIDISKPFPGYAHKDGLWFDSRLHQTYLPLAQYIFDLFIKGRDIRTVLELGAGAGSLACHLRELAPHVRVITVNGNPDTVLSPYIRKEDHFIARTGQPLEFVYENGLPVSVDLVLSFEHFEHIQERYFPVLLENILRHSGQGTICYCTAANWGKGKYGRIHCNVKPYNEWSNIIARSGYVVKETASLSPLPQPPFNFTWQSTSVLLFEVE